MGEYNIGIKDMPLDMRPREKMLAKGEKSLSEEELLAIILGMGTRNISALDLAKHLLVKYRGLRNLREVSLSELIGEHGVGPAKAVAIKAAFELGRRAALSINQKEVVKSPEDVKNIVMEEMRYFDREHFRVIYLDRKNGIIFMEDISIGGLHSAVVHPREVFKNAVKMSAAAVILIHNHPSGDPQPSKEDIELTNRLIEAGRILGIEVLDHIIIGDNRYCSLKAENFI